MSSARASKDYSNCLFFRDKNLIRITRIRPKNLAIGYMAMYLCEIYTKYYRTANTNTKWSKQGQSLCHARSTLSMVPLPLKITFDDNAKKPSNQQYLRY